MKVSVERVCHLDNAVTQRQSDGLSVPLGAPGAPLAARMGAYPARGRISMADNGDGHAAGASGARRTAGLRLRDEPDYRLSLETWEHTGSDAAGLEVRMNRFWP